MTDARSTLFPFLRRARWWWLTRNCDCHWQEPYGAVVMAGCPDHD